MIYPKTRIQNTGAHPAGQRRRPALLAWRSLSLRNKKASPIVGSA